MSTRWKRSWYNGGVTLSTSRVIGRELLERDEGVAENAMLTAENTANALGRLVEAMEDKGIFTSNEIQEIFQLYGFYEVDDEQT